MTSVAKDLSNTNTNSNVTIGCTNYNLNYNQVSFRFVIPFADIAGINPTAANDLTLKLRNVLTNVRYNSRTESAHTVSNSNTKLATRNYNSSGSVTYSINSGNAGNLSSWKGYNFTITFSTKGINNVYINADAVIARKEAKYSNASRNWYYNSGYLTRRNGADRILTYNIPSNSTLYSQKANGNDSGSNSAFLTWTPLTVSYDRTGTVTTTRNATSSEIKSNPQYISANNEYQQARITYTTALAAYQAHINSKPSNSNQAAAYIHSATTLSGKVDVAYAKMQTKYNELQSIIAKLSTTTSTANYTTKETGILYASSLYLEGFNGDYGTSAEISGISYNIKVVYRGRKDESSTWSTLSSSWVTPSTANSISISSSWCSPHTSFYGYRIKSVSPSGNSTISPSGTKFSYSGTANFSAYKAGSTVYVDIVYINDKPVVATQNNSVNLGDRVTDTTIRSLLKSVTDKEDGTISTSDSKITYTIKNSSGKTVSINSVATSTETYYTVTFSYTDRGGKTGTATARLDVTDPNAHLTIQYNIHIQDVNSVTYSNLYRKDKTAYFTTQKSVTKGTSFTFSDANMLKINKDLYNRIGLTGYCLDKVVVKRNDTNSYSEFKTNSANAEYEISNGVSFTGTYSKTNTVIYVDVYYRNIKSDMGDGK